MKKLTFAMLFITALLYLGLENFSNPTVANTVDSVATERDLYLNIMTCNKAQYDMVKTIVNDKHNIQYMFKDEKTSKDFVYTNETIKNISNMNLFLYCGNYFEDWASKLINKLDKSKVGTINVSRGIRTLSTKIDDQNIDNPYIYSSLEEYKILLYNVMSSIQDKDAKNRTLYEENYNKEINDLEKNISEIKNNKKELSEYQFIALDDNFDYFYRELGISPIKIGKDKTLQDIITENSLDMKKIIILKDNDTPFVDPAFRVVNLVRNDANLSYKDSIIKNYRSFYDLIETNS